MKKNIIAWAIIDTYPRRKKHPIEPKISNAYIDSDNGHCCGGGNTTAMGIYPTEQEATWALDTYDYGIIKQKIIQIEIHYNLK